MSKEIVLDTMYTNYWGDEKIEGRPKLLSVPPDVEIFTPIGPGALRGASRLHTHDGSLGKKNNNLAKETIEDLSDLQHRYIDTFMLPTDIQFCLCEFDKYERVRLMEGRPRAKYRP
jgi:hypothetical protein